MAFEFQQTVLPSGIRVQVALHILNHVAPEILDSGNSLHRRMAVARTWYGFLCEMTGCPDEIPDDTREWNLATLERIAQALIEYASGILGQYLRQ